MGASTYRQVTLRQIAISVITRDRDAAAFVSEAVNRWELPADAKESLECRILAAQLDAKNYEATSDGRLALARPEAPHVDGGYYVKTRENRPLIGPLPVEGAYMSCAFSGFRVMAS